MKVVSARIPDELAEFVDKEFGHGFRQTFIERCFENLRDLMTTGKMPRPSDYAVHATSGAVVDMVSTK